VNRVRNDNKQNQTGLSLIELMIAMLVGLILIAGVLSIFISSRASYGINGAVGQIQENGRFALDFIRKDTRMAGYMGCAKSSPEVFNALNPPFDTSLPYDFTTGITGFEYTGTAPGDTYNIASENPSPITGTGNWSPALDSSLQNLVMPGTDVMVVRNSIGGANPVYITSDPAPPAATFDISVPNGVKAGQIMVISDCVHTLIMQATNVTGGGTHVVHNTGAGTPGNASNIIESYFLGAQISTPVSIVYYIGQGADGSPALFEATTDTTKANGFNSQELVSGVENMQLLYGVDLTGSLVPSQYVTADNVADWSTVVSVRVALLMRSNTGALPMPAAGQPFGLDDTIINAPQDTRLRKVFMATIGIRNSLP
jgi:type IV pilus assembly protein PilW